VILRQVRGILSEAETVYQKTGDSEIWYFEDRNSDSRTTAASHYL